MQALTLKVDSSVLASAPAFDATAFNGMVGPDVSQYWSSKGLSIPVTGANAGSQAVLIQGPVSGLNVVGSDSQPFASVQDFIVNTQTGQIVYAILTGSSGSTLGSKFFVVPMSVITWQASSQGASSGGSSANLGQTTAKVSSAAFTNAPSLNSISELNLTSSGWNSQIDSYWATAK